ncbi:hypothetical protein D3C87_1229710 [compost metagenome]
MRVAILGGARPGVPWTGVAGADNDGVGFSIETGALPGRTATMAPGLDLAGFGGRIVGPRRRLDVAGRRTLLAIQTAHVAFDKRPHPHLFTGVRIAGVELADHTEFIPGAAMDQQHLAAGLVLDQHGCTRHGVAGGVISKLLVPHHFAGVLVQGDQACIEGAEVDLVAEDCRATVDHVTARANVVWQAMVIGP